MYRHKETFDFEPKLLYFKCKRHHAEVLLKPGFPKAVRSTLVRVSMLWANAGINACGTIASGTNGIGNELQKFLEIFSSSMSQTSAAMIGQNLGASQQERAKKAVTSTLIASLIFSAAISAVILIFPRTTFAIFTTDEAVKDLGVYYITMLAVQS